ncbi:MAG: NUDIX domain-containing protein [Acutalibacteraceae bacterium]
MIESAVALQNGIQASFAGLWQFPNVEGLSPYAVQTQIDQWHIPAKQILESKQSKHIFTHIEWHMNSYLIFCEAQAIDLCDQFEWMEKQDLEHIAIPTAFQPFVSVIKTYLEKK